MDILDLLKSRRSIRVYQDKPIPQDLLLQILEAGRWAPSGANLQPWHFIVVTDPETRKQNPSLLPSDLPARSPALRDEGRGEGGGKGGEKTMDHKLIQRAAKDILSSKKTIAFTGAGISVESGIPDFRSEEGLWQKYDPEEYATIYAFHSNPDKVWLMLKDMFSLIVSAKPNPAHIGLAELERMGLLSSVITQNVDGLHQAAGNNNVIEFHGNHWSLSCLNCSTKLDGRLLKLEDLPPRCSRCSSLLKPDVVFFGEPIPWEAQMMSLKESKSCDAVLVIGTSAVVYPAASIPVTAKERGAIIIEINTEPTPLTDGTSDYLILGSAGKIIPAIIEEVKRINPFINPSPSGRGQG